MIIFLYGPDTYRSTKKLNEIIDRYKKIHKSGLNLKFFDGEKLNFQDFKKEEEITPMFKEKKLIVLKNIFSNQEFKEKFLKEIKKFINSNNIIVIYEKKEVSEKDPLFEILKKNSKSQEFELLEGEKLKNWIKREFLKHKTEVDPQVIDKLIEFVGNNLWQMANEIKKLVNYKNSKRVEVKDVELLVSPRIDIDIFKTIDAISEKKKSLALSLINKHLEKGDHPLYLLKMITFQFRNLLLIKLSFPRLPKLNLPPFVIKKSIYQEKKFSLEELKKIYQKIFEIDLKIKMGKIEPETALDLFIAEV